MLNELKVIFLTGAPKVKLLDTLVSNNIAIAAIVVPTSKKYAPKYEEVVESAKRNNLKIIHASPQDLYEYIKDVDYNILLSCGYPFLIPEKVYTRAKYAINFHPTLLPKYRGRYLHYVLINKDEYTGVTAHLIDSSLDTGPIIKQACFKVSPFDTVKSLMRKSSEVEIGLVLDTLNMLRNGSLKVLPQGENESSSYFEKRTPDDSEIDPSKSLKELFYEIRAYDNVEYPAFFYVDGQKVYISLYRKEKAFDEFDMI
ncbi:MAG: hypothetical protein HYZ79_01690 [Candidatus Melainabacteria bacterium]|nr:hypothetical protein [Candidatus Melainabacteria bacterium]